MSDAAWKPLIDGLIDAVWLVDALSLRVIAANRSAAELLAGNAEDFTAMPVVELAATPEDMFFWEDVAAGKCIGIHSETLFKGVDGKVFPVDRRVTRITLPSGQHAYVLAVRDISGQRKTEHDRERLIGELRATLESTADGILVVDRDGGIRNYNRRFGELWNLSPQLAERGNDAAIYREMAEQVLNPERYANRLIAIEDSPLLECHDRIVLRSGRTLERVTLPQYARDQPIGRVYSFRDITERLADEARLRLAAKVFDASLDAIVVSDALFCIVSTNPGCTRLTGIASADLLGTAVPDLVFDPHNAGRFALIREALERDGAWEGELWHRTRSGDDAPCMVSMVRLCEPDAQVSHYIVVFKDLSETVAAKQRIEQLAYNDALTGLPNRLLLAERISFALAAAQRDKHSFAVLFLDLDRFKQINDSLGHQFGDQVLIEVAERIGCCLRQADTAARLGGDEFIILLHQADAHGAQMTAQRLLAALADPFELNAMHFTVTCSIGIALYPDDGQSGDDLIKNADSAMYYVKERGRSDFRFYQPQMNIDLLSRMKLDHAMRNALSGDGFRLHYQPQVAADSGRIFAAEALIRWHDAELGDVPPAQFIPVAEETGVIVGIGQWVLRQAVRQCALWRAQGIVIDIAVNVSAMQFRQADFVQGVADVLTEFSLPAAALELELTESILIDDVDSVLRRLESLAALGLKLSIDDFGTGYSSLAYLKRFPLHRLKVDRSFVTDLATNTSDAAIVTAIINLARSLSLRVIAEGVETDMQRQFLLTAGCEEIQGFLCSAALSVDDFAAFYHAHMTP